jgi:putative membrane protein
VIPLASAIENAQSNIECVLWGLVALIVQLVVFFTVRLFVPTISEQIKKGELAAGILLAVISVSVGIINAASMTF